MEQELNALQAWAVVIISIGVSACIAIAYQIGWKIGYDQGRRMN
jgi:cbb3-type cytochrome oxidase subunit 3